jgi:hypothetical protein
MPAKVIACQVLEADLRPLMPPDTVFESLAISLHNRPRNLAATLKEAVEAADGHYDPIFLGYGLCAQATVGLVARHSRLVLFRTDDCIGVFLGSSRARREEQERQPGTYFLTRGYIGDGTGSLFDDFPRLVRRYGEERARSVMEELFRHYRRLVLVSLPGSEPSEADRAYARANAERFGLAYEEKVGSRDLLERMASGRWGGDIAVFGPDEPVTLAAMMAPPTEG